MHEITFLTIFLFIIYFVCSFAVRALCVLWSFHKWVPNAKPSNYTERKKYNKILDFTRKCASTRKCRKSSWNGNTLWLRTTLANMVNVVFYHLLCSIKHWKIQNKRTCREIIYANIVQAINWSMWNRGYLKAQSEQNKSLWKLVTLQKQNRIRNWQCSKPIQWGWSKW